jgi:glyoxylase-like metal-dependent hydrolase (beta-lactamase superfamily II)
MVAFTHYHSDHFGGLRPFLLKGATLITTPGIREYIARIAATAHPSDPVPGLGASHPLPQIQTFTGARTIADAEAPVELHEIDGGHADEMVIIWLPRQRVLYATDLFGIFPVRGRPGGSYEAERVLAEYVRKAGWEVRTVVSGHGAISPSADLTRILSTPPAVIRRPHQLAADCRGMSQS